MGAAAAGAAPEPLRGKALLGLHSVCLPVTDVAASADWFATVLAFGDCVVFEEEDRVTGALLEHPSGAAVALRADAGRAAALSGFPALTFAVSDGDELQAWGDRLSALGVTHTDVSPANLGWEIRLWGPDMIEMRIVTSGLLDGAADDSEMGFEGRRPRPR
jgi:catechol 2,3-dioxygenase-like lactoylglutathione lyase family enzyme